MKATDFRIRTMLVVLLGAAMLSMPLWAQDAPRDRGDREGDRGDRRRQFDPAQREEFMQRMRERMSQAMKERLQATDDEWSVIEPRLTKVTELRMQSGFGGMRGMFGGRDRGPGAPGGAEGRDGDSDRPQRELSPIETKARALNEVVENKESTPEQIKSAMTELRAARVKQEQEAKAARESLREVLSLRQEATLVTMGLLD
jgi:hypothetical protein